MPFNFEFESPEVEAPANIIERLNDALAAELVCELRYRRHRFNAEAATAPEFAKEFLEYAMDESEHADRLARRIVELGGEPDFSPGTLAQRSHTRYDESLQLRAMLEADLDAKRSSIERYIQLLLFIGDQDAATRRLIADILDDEKEHADELADWLAQWSDL